MICCRMFCILMLFAGGLAVLSCGNAKIDTAEKLAEQLKENGVAFTSQGQANNVPRPPRVNIDEAIELTGPQLHVEVLRIDEEESRKMFTMAIAFVGMADKLAVQKTEQSLQDRPKIYSHDTLIVVVREEPRDGLVQEAMQSIFKE